MFGFAYRWKTTQEQQREQELIDRQMKDMSDIPDAEKLEILVLEYNTTCSQAEDYQKQGEAEIRSGIKLLQRCEKEYKHANEIRKQISEIT